MKATEFLKNYSQKSVPVYKKLFRQLQRRVIKLSPINQEMVAVLQEFGRSGKHVRGALTVLGFWCAKRDENEDIFEVGVAVDLLHTALLIADDIMDKSDLRRGKPALHKLYENELALKYQRLETPHFGVSMALNLSFLAIFFAEEIFARTSFDPKKIQKAGEFMNNYLADVTFGQGIDVVRQGNFSATINEVLSIHRLKTAYYTISGPLQIGGILGGANKKTLEAMAKYGEKVGVAFQLRDDELGIFGDERTLGKPVDSDLKEGKNTVLFVKAFEQANSEQRKILTTAFGNFQAGASHLERVRQVILETGALKFSQEMSQKLINESKPYVAEATQDEESREILYNLADFMIERKK